MMKTILKCLIDFSLFEKYEKEYFIRNKIIPIFEDNIYLKVAVCKSSNLNSIKNDFANDIQAVTMELVKKQREKQAQEGQGPRMYTSK